MTVDPSGNLVGTGSLNVTGALDNDGDGTNDVNESSRSAATITGLRDGHLAVRRWEFDGLMDLPGGALPVVDPAVGRRHIHESCSSETGGSTSSSSNKSAILGAS